MLRPLALVAVRQQHHQTRHAQPFGFARANELVDDHLSAIGEITKLGLPHDQGIGFGLAETIFEAEHRSLRQRAVDHLIGGLFSL